MSATKARTSLFNGVSVGAGGTQTSATADVHTGYGCTVNMKITNGASAPATPCQMQIYVSNDAGETLPVPDGKGLLIGGLDNNGVYADSFEIDMPIAAVHIVATGNTAQAVTVDADISNVTAI